MKNNNINFKTFVINNFKGGHLYTFVGAGGKSSAILKIGDILANNGYRVRISTTTKIGSKEFLNYFLKKTKSLNVFNKIINKKIQKILIINKYCKENQRYIGFSKKWWNQLIIPSDVIVLLEGDGAKRKFIKIPKNYEPVIPNISARVFLLLGASIINENIDYSNTYNIKKIKNIVQNDLKYTIKVLFDIILIGWSKIFIKHNFSILINQGDLIKKRKLACNLSEILFKKANIENYVVSIKKEKIYANNQIYVRGIILAAGKSSRMKNKIKCLLKLNKKSFLQKSILLLNRVTKDLIIAVGYKKEKIIQHIKKENCKFIFVEKYNLGMGFTLKKMVNSLPKGDGFFLHFCDLPLIKNKVIDLLYKEILKNKNKVIIPTYKGKNGHPIYFPEISKKFFISLKGDVGAKLILNNLEIKNIEVNDIGIIQDIDTAIEYKNIGGK